MGEKEIRLTSFTKMSRIEFTNVHVVESRFSKWQHCWEYKKAKKSMPNEAIREAITVAYCLYLQLTVEETNDYSHTRQSAIESLDDSISVIIDGLDQNTNYVLKMKQTMKGIESLYVKIHLCGILVHGIGLYFHVWIDAHHAHDSNQVVTSIMKVLEDVRRHRRKLRPILKIQAANCRRENKNIYLLALCANLVAFGFFEEVQLSILIVGHTH